MPSFKSEEGIWTPQKERVVLPDAEPGKEVYEGPDRAALEVLEKEGVDHLGMHYSEDPEMLMRAKSFNCNSVEEYMTMKNYNKDKAKVAFEKVKNEVTEHKPPEKKAPVQTLSGGRDTSGGGKSIKGGFGDPPNLK